MRHSYKKLKFKAGKDAAKMLLRKLLISFISRGKIKTTEKRAKILKSYLDRLISKAREKNEANKNYIMKILGKRKIMNKLFEQAAQLSLNKIGGYVKIVKLNPRLGDGAMLNQVEWAHPKEKPIKEVETK